ncbi:hypothetical protein FAI41_06545 [Acetobacteraceae bacterium]|nr:hypothetical protein FAI41_06545 [Acetobacteraceae bacterium]
MSLKLVSQDVVSDHKLDKLAIFHHVIFLMLFSGILGFAVFAYQRLSKRLDFLEKKAWDISEEPKA